MRTFLSVLGFLFLSITSFSQQVPKSITLNGNTLGFYEFKPYNYNQNPSKKYPLIIFLHGIGERGNGTSQLGSVLNTGLPAYIRNGANMTFTVNGETESFMVLSPQLPYTMGAWDASYIDAMLDYAEKNLRVDKKRIFLTGLSLGGGGVWSYATSSVKNAKKFAAIAPICGVCYYDYKDLPNIAKADIGVWGFANLDDNIVSPICTISAVDAIAALNKTPGKIKKTINQWGGHDAWTKAYDVAHNYQTPNLYEWFLQQSQSGNDNGDNNNGNSNSQAPQNAEPVAKAGNDVTVTLPTNSVTLNNAGSYDSDGNINGYEWSMVSGPSWPTFSSAKAASTAIYNLVEGTYVFRLTVTDNGGSSAFSDVKVYVNKAKNVAPVAKAGNAININLPTNSVTLNNSGSYDPDGQISSYKWSMVSGPSQPSIVSPNATSSQVNNLVEGSYVFRLTVSDNDGASGSEDIKVTVAPKKFNATPFAKVGDDISLTLPANYTTISNAGSYDTDGTILAWRWEFITGPSQPGMASPNNASTQVSNLKAGTYRFRLTVTDNEGSFSWADIRVIVNEKSNLAPVAVAGKDISIILPNNSASISNVASYDSDGTILSYKWSLVSGPSQPGIASPTTATTVVNNLIAGTYVFRLTVTDDDDATSYDDISVQVTKNANTGPAAHVGDDVYITLPTNSATITNAGSYDKDGKIAIWKWSFISGPSNSIIVTPNASSTVVSNLVAGKYVFRLTVTDDDGATGFAELKVIVNPQTNKQPPVANAGKDYNIRYPYSALLDGTASRASGDAKIVKYSWTKVDGPASYYIVAPSAISSWCNTLSVGAYTFRLTVTDNNGLSSYDDVVMTIKNSNSSAAGGQDLTAFEPGNLQIVTAEKVSIYPNPVINRVNISWMSDQVGNATVQVVDVFGRVVKTVPVKKEQTIFNTSIEVGALTTGIYFLQIQLRDNKTIIHRFLKN